MEKRIRYCTEYSEPLAKLLDDCQITFHRTDEVLRQNGYDFLIYTISERSPRFSTIIEFLRDFKHDSVLESVHYSEAEHLRADWLVMRATTGKVELKREEETFICSGFYENGNKAYHRRLSGKPFYVSASIKHSHSQNFFYSYECSDYEIFCTERAKRIIEPATSEIAFQEVLRDSTDAPVGDLYYMDFVAHIPAEAIDTSVYPEEYCCPCCGRKTYSPPTYPLRIKEQFLSDWQFACKTADIFSSGGNYAYPLTLISQKLYRLLKSNSLLRGLDFVPVETI